MAFLDTKQQRASWVILLLGIGLALALWPFVTGLIGAPVLYIIFAAVHRELSRRMPVRLAAVVTLLLALLLIVIPACCSSACWPAKRRTWPAGWFKARSWRGCVS
jgi:predicted PurR-regulated permease PerM